MDTKIEDDLRAKIRKEVEAEFAAKIREAVDAEVALIVEWLRSADHPRYYREIAGKPKVRDALASDFERRAYRTVAQP